LATFNALKITPRAGQVELLLTVVSEMSGEVDQSAQSYQALAGDPRLSALDRARAQLWVGTALTKSARQTVEKAAAAIKAITGAINHFERLDEPDEWSVGHQKLALAHLAAGDLDAAYRSMDTAVGYGQHESPLQQVKLGAARAHIFLTDRATRPEGLILLGQSRTQAMSHNLTHQVASIDRIMQTVRDSGTTRKKFND
jgi:hypothetical protein